MSVPRASGASNAATAAAEPPPVVQRGSTMDEHWELRRDLKRGIFNLVPHRPLYGLIHWTDNRLAIEWNQAAMYRMRSRQK